MASPIHPKPPNRTIESQISGGASIALPETVVVGQSWTERGGSQQAGGLGAFLPGAQLRAAARGLTEATTAVVEAVGVDRAHYLGVTTSLPSSFEAVYPNHYHLEFYDDWKSGNDPLDAFILPYVNSIQMQAPLALTRTWTLDSLYEEHTGIRQKAFTITGRSGFLAEDLIRFHRFRNFIETYAEVSQENRSAFLRLKDTRLVLNFPFEGESYFCSIVGFQYAREVGTSRMSFTYQIQLLTQGWAMRKWRLPSFMVNYLTDNDPNGDHLTPQHNCHHYKNTVEEQGTGELPTGPDDAVEHHIIGRHYALEVGNAARGGAARAYEQVLPPGTKTPTDPDFYRDLWWLTDAAIVATGVAFALANPDRQLRLRYQFALRNMWYNELKMQAAMYLGVQYEKLDLYAGVATTGEDFIAEVGGNYGPAAFLFSLGTVGKQVPPAKQPRTPRPVPVRPEPVTATTTLAGDTSLIDVAGRVLGDPTQWAALVALNGWQDARTQPNGAPFAAGVTVIVPAPSGTPAPTAEDLYGTDILLDEGDFVIVGDDIAIVGGPDNLLQNLKHRMLTDRGTNTTFPAYGLVPRLGDATTGDTLALTMSDVRLQAVADHRVANLQKLDVRQSADRLMINFEVEAITRARVQASFVRPGNV